MTEPEKKSVQAFLRRWSRRKLTAVDRAAADTPDAQGGEPESQHAPAPQDANRPEHASSPDQAPPAFDPTALPPIESIHAASDIRPFLSPGVPEELTRAALRRVWVADPAIRDFVGLAENQWDFTRPDGVPGFGELKVTAELRRMISGLFGDASLVEDAQAADTGPTETRQTVEESGQCVEAPPQPASAADAASLGDGTDTPGAPQASNPLAAAQRSVGDAAPQQIPSRHKHGSAVPK